VRVYKIYYQELAHTIMEVAKSQDLQSKGQAEDPGEMTVWFQADSEGLRSRRANGIAPSQRAAG
jgi:hypothetical protein